MVPAEQQHCRYSKKLVGQQQLHIAASLHALPRRQERLQL
jgi:hypothetical protein